MNLNYEKLLINDKKKFHSQIGKYMKKRQYDKALVCISAYSKYAYDYNQFYYDEYLEESLKECVNALFPERDIVVDKSKVLFFDSFGLEPRGLAGIYIDALINKNIDFVYVTYEQYKSRVPLLINRICASQHGKVVIIKEKAILGQIEELIEVIKVNKIGNILLYNTPNEIVSTSCAHLFKGQLNSYLINLTDHAFWLGATAADYIVEFRNYGAYITKHYRCKPEDAIIKLPYYPKVYTDDFVGLPFPSSKKFILSGGALYKTLSEDNKYYLLIDKILATNTSIIFYYIGDGDNSRLQTLMNKYPERVFHSNERKDFFEVMKRAEVYINTYPMIGGLMTQYAAIAGVMPMILRYDECGEGLLLDEKSLGNIYDDVDSLADKVNRLLTDNDLLLECREELKKQVISPEDFANQLTKMIDIQTTDYSTSFDYVDTTAFLKTYIERITSRKYFEKFAYKTYRRYWWLYPVKMIIGGVLCVFDRVRGLLNK